MKNILSIIGIALIVAAVLAGYFWGFSQAWILQLVGTSAGLALIIGTEVKRRPVKERWKAYLIGFTVSIGTILAIYGGLNESIITTIIGSVLVIAGAAVGIVSGVRNGRT